MHMGWSHVQHIIDVTASFQVICSAQPGTRQGLAQNNGQLAWQHAAADAKVNHA